MLDFFLYQSQSFTSAFLQLIILILTFQYFFIFLKHFFFYFFSIFFNINAKLNEIIHHFYETKMFSYLL